jgi:hypothetical protein
MECCGNSYEISHLRIFRPAEFDFPASPLLASGIAKSEERWLGKTEVRKSGIS